MPTYKNFYTIKSVDENTYTIYSWINLRDRVSLSPPPPLEITCT